MLQKLKGELLWDSSLQLHQKLLKQQKLSNELLQNSKTIEEKENAVQELLKTLKIFELRVDKEIDSNSKSQLQKQYSTYYNFVQQQLTHLQQLKQQQQPQPQKDPALQILDSISNSILKNNQPLNEGIVGSEKELIQTPINESVYIPIKFPQVFDQVRQSKKSLLIYGPQGVGKSLITKNFISQKNQNCTSYYIDESYSQNMTQQFIYLLFQQAMKYKPSIICFDSISCYQPNVLQSITQNMNQLDNVKLDVFVIFISNQPWTIPPNFLQNVHFKVYLPLPENNTREQLVQKQLSTSSHTLSLQQIQQIAQQFYGYSCLEIINIIQFTQQQTPQQQLIKASSISENYQQPQMLQNTPQLQHAHSFDLQRQNSFNSLTYEQLSNNISLTQTQNHINTIQQFNKFAQSHQS